MIRHHTVLAMILVVAALGGTAQAAQWSLSDIQSKVQAAQANARQSNLTPTQAYQRMNAEAHQISAISAALNGSLNMMAATRQLLAGEEGDTGPGPVVDYMPAGKGQCDGDCQYQCPNPRWKAQISPNVTSTLALGGNVMALAYALQAEVEAWQADSASAFSLVKTHSVADLQEVVALISKANNIVGNEMGDVAGTLSNPTNIQTLPVNRADLGMGAVYAPSSEQYRIAGYTNAGNSYAPHCPIGAMTASDYGLHPQAADAAQHAMQLDSSQTQGLLTQFAQGPNWSLEYPVPDCVANGYVCVLQTYGKDGGVTEAGRYFAARQSLVAGLAYNTGIIRGRLQQLLPGIQAANAAIQQATAQFDQALAQAGFNAP